MKSSGELLAERKALPIWPARQLIRAAVEDNQVLIVLGETGSGKSTQIPQFLLKRATKTGGMIAVTQPRRISAVTLAARVAQEQGTVIGQKVGYAIRFDDRTSSKTVIKYLTDGLLLRELIHDPMLSRYSVVIIDESHERTVLTDLLLGFLKGIIKQRPSLRLIVMSATIDAQKFSDYFQGAEIRVIEGRQYPVDIMYTTEPVSDYIDASLRTIYQIHFSDTKGDILVFLSGQEDIENLEASVKYYAAQIPEGKQKILTCPLYAALPQSIQRRAFKRSPSGYRKVILATNVAETSITVPGTRFVIDAGLAKVRQFDSMQGLETLLMQPISKASARQRAGRAGRETSGTCFRLYTEKDFLVLNEHNAPEMMRVDLSTVVLTLKVNGIDNVLDFPFIDRPSKDAILRALEQLFALSALSQEGKLTTLGQKMSILPLSPQLARILLAGAEYSCLSAIIDIISCLSANSSSAESLILRRRNQESDDDDDNNIHNLRFAAPEGDHITLLNIWREYNQVNETDHSAVKPWCKRWNINRRLMKTVEAIRRQISQYCMRRKLPLNRVDVDDTKYENVLKALLHGYVLNTAILQPNGTYRHIADNQVVYIHPSSVLMGKKRESIMFHEVVFTTKPYVRNVSAVQPAWCKDLPVFNRLTIT